MNGIIISSQNQELNVNLTPNVDESTRCITGRITDKCGVGIDNACIKAVSVKLSPIVHTTSDTDGEYTLVIPSQNDIKMIVSKKGYITVNTGINHVETQDYMLQKEQLNTCIIKGKIIYTDCMPAEQLRVRICSADYNKDCFTCTNGNFIFTNVPAGKYTMTIDGNECIKKSIYIDVESYRDYDVLPEIVVHRKFIGGTLHGIVNDCIGNPVSNAVIVLYNHATKKIISHTTSNQDGIYFFGNLTIGNYYVEAYY